MFANNPVLQRELIVNLRTPRSFILLLVYQVALAAVILIAYPTDTRIDLSRESASAQKLVDFFFLGQFVLASLMAPSFAAGAITGEKERKTYEMLLASPLRPAAIVFGKLVASLTHLSVLIIGSLPIIMLCLPLGGVSIYELLAAFAALLSSILLFGSIAVYCSSKFKRTSSSLVVSYIAILPMVIVGCTLWRGLADYGGTRFFLATVVLPIVAGTVSSLFLYTTGRRLLYPPDVGSQGNEVVDLEQEQREAVGLVIQRDQFPDKLFAPPRRKTLMQDGSNPVYDKELHAELFSQGTLMLRLVIQISMLLAIPLMAIMLFFFPHMTGWYLGYVIVFNILVAPVFLAGSISSERERQTIELLLTTLLSPWQILWGKALAGYRVSFVLTMFVTFPVALAFVLNGELPRHWPSVLVYVLIAVMATVFNAVLAMFCSTMFRKTSTAMMISYLVLLIVYFLPLAIRYLVDSFSTGASRGAAVAWLGVASPFSAIQSIPWSRDMTAIETYGPFWQDWGFSLAYFAATLLLIGGFLVVMIYRIQQSWRLADKT